MTITTELEFGDVQTITPYNSSDADAVFDAVWRLNPDARIEQTSEGEIIIMPPAGGESGHQSGEAFLQLASWTKADGTGVAFDSSTTFRLPNHAKRSLDASWVNKERIRSLPKAVRKEFPPFAPDFAIEVKSQSDRRRPLHEKCQEYIANGTSEAWLIDPEKRTVHVYSAAGGVSEFKDCLSVTGRYLPSFTMDLGPIWQGLDV